MTFTTSQLASYVGGTLHGDTDVRCCGASIDSRLSETGNVFFALQGEHTDGHEYVEAAATAGCSALIVEKTVDSTVPFIIVQDVRRALYDLAKNRRAELPVQKVIAVTGSVGKTTAKDMIACMLGEQVVASKKSFNNDLGVPLTILAAEAAEFLVAEIGANDVGEIEPLAELIQPDIAVLTSIDKAHLEGFGTQAAVLAEKVKLLEALPSHGVAILPHDIDVSSFDITAPIITVGTSDSADIRIEVGIDSFGFATLKIGTNEVTLSMLGEHNAMNAALALVACGYAQPETAQVQFMNRLASFKGPAGRLQKVDIAGISFIDDSYNANPASMQSALNLIATMSCGRKVLILGDMLELGEHAHAEHRLLGNAIEKVKADVVILVGQHMHTTSQTTPSLHEPEASIDAMQRIAALLKFGDTVLLKGSRDIQLERIIEIFEMEQQTQVSPL